MFNKAKRIIALLMAVVLVFSLAGCGNTGNESDVEIEYQDVYVDQYGNPVDPNAVSSNNNTTDASSEDNTSNASSDNANNNSSDNANNTSSDNKQNNTSSDNKQNNTSSDDKQNNTSSDDKQNNTSSDNNANSNSNGVNPEDYRGKTVVFATTILSSEDESGPVVDSFEKQYGITVKEVLVGEIITEVGGMIASGQTVDCIRSNGDFPAVMSIMQSLTPAKLDYNDPIWDQNVFKESTYGGEPYLCSTVGNIWNEAVCVLYSKSLLQRAGAYTPEEYDKAGKWTWDAFAEIARAVNKLEGAYGCTFDIAQMLGSAGVGIYDYNNGKFENGMKDERFVEAFTKLTQWRKEGFVTDSGVNQFSDGTVGLAVSLGWGLKKNGSNVNANWNDIGCYYLPAYDENTPAYSTSFFRGWGLVRGSKEPVAAGLFLRYYLDVNNYDTSSAFIHDEAEKFFFEYTNVDYDRIFMDYTYGLPGHNMDSITGGFEKWDVWNVSWGDPAQVATQLKKLSDALDKAIININNHVAKNTGLK